MYYINDNITYINMYIYISNNIYIYTYQTTYIYIVLVQNYIMNIISIYIINIYKCMQLQTGIIYGTWEHGTSG